MVNGGVLVPPGCRNPALWRTATEILAGHVDDGPLCSCLRARPCTVQMVARRAQVKAMPASGPVVGWARVPAQGARRSR